MKIDTEVLFFKYILHLKEEKNKIYSPIECSRNIAYVFNNEEEYIKYFKDNGFNNVSEDILYLCKMVKTKKGKIISLKGLCDHAITRHKEITEKKYNDIIDDNLINSNKIKLLNANFR